MIATVRYVPDSFATLRTLAAANDVTADVIVTDPPYPEEVQGNLCSGSLVGTKAVPKYELGFDPLTVDQRRQWVADALAITKRWVVSFCAVEDFGRLQDNFRKAYVRGGIWAKRNAMGQLTADRPATAYEGVACLHRTDVKKRWNGRGSYGIWGADDPWLDPAGFMYECSGTRGKKDRHPNEKPLDLALKLVALFSERGETVFDPFAGSAAIGEACVLLGRNYVGLDFDPAWVEKANRRLEAAKAMPAVVDEEALKLCAMWGKAA